MKSKNIINRICTTICSTALLACMAFTTQAQSTIPPSNPDQVMPGMPGILNTAMIDYSNFCGLACASGTTQIAAVVVGAPGPTWTLYVSDKSVGAWMAATPVPVPTTAAFFADVVIGHDMRKPSDFIVGVVDIESCPMYSSNVMLYLYHVVGPPPYTLIPAPYAVIPIATSCSAVPAPRIDIETQYSTSFFGSPLVNNFVITWPDYNTGIMGYAASLNNPTSGTVTVINPNLSMSSPDVAMVERYNPGTGGYEDWALFTYLYGTGPSIPIFYQEWQLSPASAVNPPMVYGVQPSVTAVNIDAIDDYHFNNPGPMVYPGAPAPTTAFFDIAASVAWPSPPGGSSVVEYNNITGPGVGTDITAGVTGVGFSVNGFNMSSAVTAGPGPFYTIGYFNNMPANNYYATAIDWATGIPSTDPNAYQVNMSPILMGPPFFFSNLIGVAATCNTNTVGTQQLFTAFDDMLGMVYYSKYDLTVAPYGFRHSSQAQAVNVGDWQLSPNPATNETVLMAPSAFTAKDGGTYRITDLSGRELLHGNIASATQQIDLNGLTAGMYLLNVYTSSAGTKTIKFVKE